MRTERQTDRHDEANSRFSQTLRTRLKTADSWISRLLQLQGYRTHYVWINPLPSPSRGVWLRQPLAWEPAIYLKRNRVNCPYKHISRYQYGSITWWDHLTVLPQHKGGTAQTSKAQKVRGLRLADRTSQTERHWFSLNYFNAQKLRALGIKRGNS